MGRDSYYRDYVEDFDENDYDAWANYEDEDSLFDIQVEEVGSVNSGQNGANMSASQVGTQFSTGNSTVKTLKVGTVLEVVGPGRLEIIEVGSSIPSPGDRIDTKYGPATVVRQSTRLEFDLDENEVLYVADSDPVVRRLAV